MTLAICKALEEGAKAVVCASTGNTQRVGGGVRGEGGHHVRGAGAQGQGRARARWRRPSCTARGCWRSRATSTTALELAKDLAERYPVTLVNSREPVPAAGPEDRARSRSCDALGPRARPALRAGRQRRQHLQPLDGVLRVPARRRDRRAAAAVRVPGRRARRRSCAASPVKDPQTIATAIRIGNPASWDKAVGGRHGVRGCDRRRHRPRDPRRLPAASRGRGCSPSRRAPRASPACCICTPTGSSRAAPPWSASSPATA